MPVFNVRKGATVVRQIEAPTLKDAAQKVASVYTIAHVEYYDHGREYAGAEIAYQRDRGTFGDQRSYLHVVPIASNALSTKRK